MEWEILGGCALSCKVEIRKFSSIFCSALRRVRKLCFCVAMSSEITGDSDRYSFYASSVCYQNAIIHLYVHNCIIGHMISTSKADFIARTQSKISLSSPYYGST